jgi:hypothetical protein
MRLDHFRPEAGASDDASADIVRFQAPQSCHDTTKSPPQADATRRASQQHMGASAMLPDPDYWLKKARDFRRAALAAAPNEDAAILSRRAAEFERMAALMAAEHSAAPPAPVAPPPAARRVICRRAQRLAR